MTMSQKECHELLCEVDLDRNGTLSFSEFLEFLMLLARRQHICTGRAMSDFSYRGESWGRCEGLCCCAVATAAGRLLLVAASCCCCCY
jgi:hypothetical protein